MSTTQFLLFPFVVYFFWRTLAPESKFWGKVGRACNRVFTFLLACATLYFLFRIFGLHFAVMILMLGFIARILVLILAWLIIT